MAIAAAASLRSHGPITEPPPPLLQRLNLGLQTWAFKGVVNCALPLMRWRDPSKFQQFAPTYTKKYGIRPSSECRVFIPSTYKSGQKLPLYINIHGGGFTIGEPQLDDPLCHFLSNKFGYIVVSLQYRLAPTWPFPYAVDDCIELSLAVLDDTELPVDHDRVAMGGQSAGGNLILAAVQDPRLLPRIKALVPIYPVVDFSKRYAGEFRDRPANSEGQGAKKDILRPISDLFRWAYMPYHQDRTDTRLSVIYADRSSFPKSICFVAAQYDKLCYEAFQMAKKLAGDDNLQEDEDWDKNGIRWERLPDAMHGFIEQDWKRGSDGEMNPWSERIEGVLSRVAAWLETAFQEGGKPGHS